MDSQSVSILYVVDHVLYWCFSVSFSAHVVLSYTACASILCQFTVMASSLSSFLAVLLNTVRLVCTEPDPETGRTDQARFSLH